MKKGFWIITVILVMTASCAGYPPGGGYYGEPDPQQYPPTSQQYPQYPQQQYGPYQDDSYFYDRLSPYGNWINLQPYGYVWTPRGTGYRWRPYSDGRWVWTDYGWTWIAAEDWGDIPFHYGRWGWDNYIGWFWVPGTVWGPAWVTWRTNDQYMGWAPLPPGVEFGAGMSFDSRSLDIPLIFWIFIQGSRFQDRYLNPYILPYERNQTIINYTSITTNIYIRNDRIINEGIGLDAVRRITGRTVPRYALQDVRQAGRTRIVGQEVQVFRPALRKNEAAKPKVFMNREQAREELEAVKIFDPRGQRTIDTEAATVRKRQNEEMRLLKTSQDQEIKVMERKLAAEERQLRNASEKAKIKKDYAAKISELKKNHVVEKQQMTKRHNSDTEQVKQIRKIKKTPAGKKNKDN